MVRTIRIGWRVVTVTLALATAFSIAATATERDVAAAENATREAVEETCLEEGGIYWEEYKDGKVVSFGCIFPEGDEWWCSEITTSTGGGLNGCLYTYGAAAPSTSSTAPLEPSPATGPQYGGSSAYAADERQP